jgi:hypothetical protein
MPTWAHERELEALTRQLSELQTHMKWACIVGAACPTRGNASALPFPAQEPPSRLSR